MQRRLLLMKMVLEVSFIDFQVGWNHSSINTELNHNNSIHLVQSGVRPTTAERCVIKLKSICGCLTDPLANRFKGYSIIVKSQTITDISGGISTKWLSTQHLAKPQISQ